MCGKAVRFRPEFSVVKSLTSSENDSLTIKPATQATRHATNAVFPRCERGLLVRQRDRAKTALRAALEQRAEWVVVGEAVRGLHALETFHLHNAHLTLMDFIMPQMSGLEAARRSTERHPDVLILMVTTDPSKQLQIEARREGIKGVFAKNEMECLLKAVEVVMNGGTYLNADTAA